MRTMDEQGNFTGWKPDSAGQTEQLKQNITHVAYSVNFVWTLICGFLCS